MDRRFEGLIASLILHALLVIAIFVLAPSAPPPAASERVEVDFSEPKRSPPKTKTQTFVEETNVKPKPLEELKDTARFLSQFTKRVKKQLVAQQNGPTRNSKLNLMPNTMIDEQPLKKSGVAGMERDRPENETPPKDRGDVGLPVPGGARAMHQVAIGPSSIAEYIPGVEVGDFTVLNTDQFTYYAFYSRINEQIRNRWTQAIRAFVESLSNAEKAELAKRDRETVIELILKPNGEFESKVLISSSGSQKLDDVTTRAFASAAPFTDPPRGLIEDDKRIHLKGGFVVRFSPPFGQGGY